MDKITKEEALAKVAGVLEEALAEYEALEKMEDGETVTLAKADDIPVSDDKKDDEEEQQEEASDEVPAAPAEGEEQEDEEAPAAPADEEAPSEDEESDEDLMAMKKALDAKLEKRGLLKAEPKATSKKEEVMKKTEPKAEPSEDLRKSIDDRFDMLNKTISAMSETIQKIASQPAAARKSVAGYAPLKKNEEGSEQPLNKAQALDQLVDLKKSGDKRVTTSLIARFETGRVSNQEIEFIKGLLA